MSLLNNLTLHIGHKIYKYTLFNKTCIHQISCAKYLSSLPNSYSNWQISKYGDVSQLKLTEHDNLPILQNKNQVLIKVHASSVNQIDVKILGGYGDVIMSAMKHFTNCQDALHQAQRFPLVLGRDFSGTIVYKSNCSETNHYNIGDEVYGALHPLHSGSHSQYIVANVNEFSLKPKSLNFKEASCLPYVAMTTHSAICGIPEKYFRGKRILVLGASGGIGTYVTQLMSARGANVYAVCSLDSHTMVSSLGALECRDYADPRHLDDLRNSCDFIFDTVNRNKLQKFDWSNLLTKRGRYIYFDSPLLTETDSSGMLCGLIKSGLRFTQEFTKGAFERKLFTWAFFRSSVDALKTTSDLVNGGQLKPIIDSTFKYSDTPKAYNNMISGHQRVINIYGLLILKYIGVF